VRLKLDLIVVDACGAPLNATSQATRTIPIVVAACNDDLVATGLISSLARPGGNITGLSELTPELGAKRLELLKQAASGMRRVAVLWNPTYSERFNPNFRFWTSDWKEMRAAAQALDVTLQSVECAWGLWGRSYSRLDDISHRGRWNIQGVLVPWPPVLRLGQVIRGPVEVCQNSLCGRRIFPWYSVGNCQVRVS
ncbi:MAG TPA: ABC transporter substrate binding protein, partial [Candidatus Angelobacter sp.]|nr:ABC transporter substrate binding protein [Candidatus Angelobacter sp.]